jgi:hypothetical protein
VEEVQKVFQVMAVMQQQVDQAEEVKVIQIVHLVLQELVQQEILLLQLPLKETLVEMEFNLLLLDAHKLLVAVEELEHVEQMLFNQPLVLVTVVLVVLDWQVLSQDHLSLMVAVVVVEKEWVVDLLVQVEQAVVELVEKQIMMELQEL